MSSSWIFSDMEVLHIIKFYFSIRRSPNDVIGTGKYEQALSMLLQVIFLRLFEADHLNSTIRTHLWCWTFFLTSGPSSGIQSVFLLPIKCIKFFQRITNYDRTEFLFYRPVNSILTISYRRHHSLYDIGGPTLECPIRPKVYTH